MEKPLLIGIDPDVTKSGVAYLERSTKKLELSNKTFFQLLQYLQSLPINQTKVIIEAGWLNKSNWHTVKGSPAINAQIGQRTGANHETGKKIGEMCEYLGLQFEFHKPIKSKIDHKLFQKITGVTGRTNPEMRDAAMLVWY